MTVVDAENTVVDERTPLLSENSSETVVTPEEPILNKPSQTDLYWILVALWTAVFLGALDGTIVATLLTSIGSYFDKAHMASHLGTSYLLSVCCFTPLYGRLSDILGRKGAMLLALSLFGFGTALCGIAPSMETLIAARAVAGMGGGGVMTVSSITVTDIIPLKRRGVYQGLTNILFGVGAGLGGPLGGYINDHIGWRWAFLAQIPILLLACVLVAWKVNVHLPNSSQTVQEKLARIDYLGSLTLLMTVSSLLLGVTFKANEEKPWDSLLVWPFFVIFVLSAVAFILVEAKIAAEPIMPLRLLEERTPLCIALANFTLSIVSFSVLYNVPIYFSAVRLQSATDAGLHLLPNSFALAIGSVTSGVIMRATGKYYYLTLFSASLSVVASVAMALWNDNSGQFTLWMAITPSGFGLASLLTSTLIALISSVSREDFAVATGISYLFRTTGQVLSVSINGSLLQAVLQASLRKRIHGPDAHEIIQTIRHSTTIIRDLEPEIREAAVESYALALKAVFLFQTAAAVITFLLCLPIQENPLPGSHEEQAEQDRLRRERLSERSR